MALCGSRTLLVVTVVMIGMVYQACPSFPESASNHWLKCVFGLFVKFVSLVTDMADCLGLNGVQVRRALWQTLALGHFSNPDIERYTTMMDGIEVLILKPKGSKVDELRPGIVHFHGGGWVLHSPEFYLPDIEQLVIVTHAILVSVNYRRAPEHIYPAALDDCVQVTKYFLEHTENYGVDKNRVGLYGDSAGGNLVMATALSLLRFNDLPKLKVMTLIYPALQALDFSLPSYRQYEHGPGMLTKHMMIEHWLDYIFGHRRYYSYFYNNSHISEKVRSQYSDRISVPNVPETVKSQYQQKEMKDRKGDFESPTEGNIANKEIAIREEIKTLVLDPLLSPLIALNEELVKLPRTFILTAEIDILRDEGYIAADRLRNAGVTVEHMHLATEQHGCLPFVGVASGPYLVDAYDNIGGFMIQSFHQ